MADSNTPVLDLLLMETDSHANDWGDQTNGNLELIARAIGATVAHAVTTGTTVLTRDDVADVLHRVTGTLVGNVTIEVPATEPKTYFWKNETTGAFTVTVKVNGQTGVVLPQNETRLLRCNGTDVVDAGLFNDKFATAVGGTADAITVTTVPAYSAYTTAMRFRFTAGGANTVTNPTVNVDGLGVKTLKKLNNQALAIGDIPGSGFIADCTYDGTSLILLNPGAIVSTAVIGITIDNGSAVITTGIKGDIHIPFACTITEVVMYADQTGSIVIDIWKDLYVNFPPVVGDSITASAKPTISSSNKSKDSTLTGWTTAIPADSTLRFNVDSVTSIQRVHLALKVTK